MESNYKVTTSKTWLYPVILLLYAAVFLFVGIGNVQLVDWDENIYAEASRQMMDRGDYLNVYVNNHLFAEKPPFYFWEQVLSYKIFGVNEFAARFPSGVAGVLMVVLFYYIGRRIEAPKMGLIWGLVYLTSFLPSIFGRVAVIDHTFNLFIACATYFLYLADDRFRNYLDFTAKTKREPPPKRTHLQYLTAASIFMGIATLTKGPLGGVIPLVSFAGYKLFYKRPRIRIRHFLYCAVISLTIALSWYLLNWLKTGESFLTGFIRFQLQLFSKPLEGHDGPIFYHFIVAFLGLLPWTPLLFADRPFRISAMNRNFAPLYKMGITWVGFVLLLFSLVSTKLPHYSASIYIPLSMMVAFGLYHYLEGKKKLPTWCNILLVILGIGLALIFIGMPSMLKEYARIQMVRLPPMPIRIIVMLGVSISICFIATGFFFHRQKLITGLVLIATAMLLFTQGLWRLQLPAFIEIHQKPLLEIVSEANSKGGRVVFYRMVSFAAFFYGGQSIEVLHNYKFPGDPAILDHRQEKDLYIISDIENAIRLQTDHPLVEKLNQVGRICLFKIAKLTQSE